VLPEPIGEIRRRKPCLRLLLIEPKHVIGSGDFMQSKPVWVEDLDHKKFKIPKNLFLTFEVQI
jgi:hypothetical protein